jgi:hypothetical protein
MKRLAIACSLGLLLLVVSALGAEYTGFISDDHCGAKHMDGSQASTDCVTSCVRSGGAPVFVSMEKKVYKLSDRSKVTAFYGKKVVITGTMKGDTVTIEKVEAAK